ncbi:hypothetical protein [Enterococcus wangshanyuanii]|uniref:DUF5105 domain-containing protein n=1 Tax=Enterococcus wangshanyuanii TaxID=2005703 RepID=A0ABQ1P8G6_9ENTE|nr:hypothetical protein [Enterococcus wangshanyuanii]GGC92751.1 hypothetical protein GCM10011573_22970 [Enterococcus wangshanyuanii]
MKKLFWLVPIIFVLGGCNSAKQMTDYIEVDFSGMDTKGTASYNIDTKKMYKDVFDYDVETGFPDEKTQKELISFDSSYKVKLNKDQKLSNGDKVKVTVSVDENKTKRIKGGEKEFTVSGLEEPKKLTNEEVMKHLVVNFNGVSGRGEATIDNTFDDPLNYIEFTIEDDGKLKNGDKAKVQKSKEFEQSLNDQGYVLTDDFNPEFEVKGLKNVAEKATDIANLEDIKRMIDEEVKRSYKDSYAEESYGRRYEIALNKLFYRQFAKDNTNEETGNWFGNSSTNNGNLIGIYTIKQYSGGTESKLQSEFTAIIGYSDIILDENKQANVADIKEISTTKDDSYSLESVLKLYEGYGYSEVK